MNLLKNVYIISIYTYIPYWSKGKNTKYHTYISHLIYFIIYFFL